MVRISGKRGKCSDPNLLPQNIKKGVTILDVTGTLEYEDPDLVPGNVRKGVNIFGVTGTFEGGTKMQKFSIRLSNGGPFTVDFTPKIIFGLYAGEASTDTGEDLITSFWGQEGSTELKYQISRFSRGSSAFTKYVGISGIVTWGNNRVTLSGPDLNGRYDIFIMG